MIGNKNSSSLINDKAWWDNMDALRKPLGLWLKSTPEQFNHLSELVDQFKRSASIWERRVAITAQLQNKEKTDIDLLAQAIDVNLHEDEFFIQKGIGWALREYSKINPVWGKEFITSHPLSKLAAKEGGKYI